MPSQRRLELLSQHLSAPAAPSSTAERRDRAGYVYTADHDEQFLSDADRAFYEENGFLVVRTLLPGHALDQYKARFIDLTQGRVERPATMTLMRDVAAAKQKGHDGKLDEVVVSKVQDFQDDEVLFSYSSHPAVLPYVKCFIGKDIEAIHTMLINKPPNLVSTSIHPLHQDFLYFPLTNPNRIVCSWTALERVNKANGCLMVIPGSHKGELMRHGYPVTEGKQNAMYHGVVGEKELMRHEKLVYLEMEAGDTVFFHPILLHGSGPNTTTGFRKAISTHYASSSETKYLESIEGTSREELGKEVEGVAKRKYGAEISFTDVWRFKSRLVAGKERTD